MANVIDSLAIELKLDPRDLSAGLTQATAAFTKAKDDSVSAASEIERQGHRASAFFDTLGSKVLALYAIFTAGRGLKQLAEDVTEADRRVGLLAKTMDMSVQALSSWGNAARLMGGHAESVEGDMAGLSNQIQRFLLTGEGRVPGLLQSIGISFRDANGHVKTMNQLFFELAQQIEARHLDPARAKAFLTELGLGEDSINLILMGTKNLQEYLSVTEKLAATKGDVDAAMARTRAFNEMELALEKLMRDVLTPLTPELVAIEKAWEGWVNDIDASAPSIAKAVGGFLHDFLEAIKEIREAIAWLDEHVAPVLNMLANPFGTSAPASTNPNAGFLEKMFPNWATSPIGRLWNQSAAGSPPLPSSVGGAASAAAGFAGIDYPTIQKFVRSTARTLGIDPDVAEKVMLSESSGNAAAIGDKGTSGGLWQLHYGGGLGDLFSKVTGGLSAMDPTTWMEQTKFALSQAAQHGWGPWHGWKGAAWAGIGGVPADHVLSDVAQASTVFNNAGTTNSSKSEVHIGSISIAVPPGTDAQGIVDKLQALTTRDEWTSHANTGQQ